MGEVGSVAWMFESKGQIIVEEYSGEEDDLMEIALEAGAEDFVNDDGTYEILTSLEDLETVREALENADIKIANAEMAKLPKNTIDVEDKNVTAVLGLMDALEDLDDVQNVYSNFDIDPSQLNEGEGE
jgi:transcriptional/translational regulatory protein YebC/TACO1